MIELIFKGSSLSFKCLDFYKKIYSQLSLLSNYYESSHNKELV